MREEGSGMALLTESMFAALDLSELKSVLILTQKTAFQNLMWPSIGGTGRR